MIALDKVISDTKKYSDYYESIGLDLSLKYLLRFEDNRKALQIEYENLKANTNKLCNLLAQHKENKKEMRKIYNTILAAQHRLNDITLLIKYISKLIDEILKQLPNLPDYYIDKNEVMSENPNLTKFESVDKLYDLIKPSYTFETNKLHRNINSKLIHFKNNVFEDGKSVLITNYLGAIILVPDYELESVLNLILEFMKKNSNKVYKVKTSNLKPTSSGEYVVMLDKDIIKIEVKREYFTREYSIKYKNKNLDMTKFLNQINLIYK